MHSEVPSDTEDRGGLEELEEGDGLGIREISSKADGSLGGGARKGRGGGEGRGKEGRGREGGERSG